MRTICLCTMLLLWCIKAAAQGPAELLFHHLDSRSGLGDPKLWDVFKDSYGLLWIASENGLTRFDGTSCRVYRNRQDDSSSICANYIVNIIEDRNHNLWVGTQNGLARYNRQTDNFTNFKKLKADKPLASNFYSFPFFIDDQNYLWAYLGGEVFKINIATRTAYFVSTFSNGHIFVNQPFYTPLKRYVSRGTNGIFITDISKGKELRSQGLFMQENGQPEMPVTYVHQVLMEHDTQYWLCSDLGLICLNPVSKRYTIYTPQDAGTKNAITSIATVLGYPHLFYIGSQGSGLYIFDAQKRAFTQRYVHDPNEPLSLASNNVIGILPDKDNNIFVLMPGAGMDYANIEQARFSRLLPRSEALNLGIDNYIKALAYCKGFLVAGAGQSGIIIRNMSTGEYTKHLPGVEVSMLLLLPDGRVLVSGVNGDFHVLSLHNNSWQVRSLACYGLEDIPGKLQVNHLCYAGGQLFAATASGLATCSINNKGIRFHFIDDVNTKVEWPNFQYIFPVSDTVILLQTYYTNLYRFKLKNGVFSEGREIARTPFQTNGHVAGSRYIWLATSSGLWYIDKNTWKLQAYGLENYYCTGMQRDVSGKLWCATTNGMLAYDVATRQAQQFRPEDGLQHLTYNTHAMLSLPDGRFAAGGTNGINIFQPVGLQEKPASYSVQLSAIEINEKPFTSANPLVLGRLNLNHRQNTLAFRITPLSYGQAGRLPVHYLLEGYEATPVTIYGEGVVRYPQLPPGDYTFVAYGNDGRQRKLFITIHPPFWATWWFRLLLVIVIAGIVVAGVRWRIKNIKARQLQRLQLMIQSQEEERRRIARDLHDDFGARLSTLKLYMQAIEKKQSPEPVQIMHHAAGMIDGAITELRNILFNLSPKTLDENGLKAALEDLAGHINRLQVARCHIDTAGLHNRLAYHTEFSLYRICQELVNNTIKYAAARHIYLSIVEHEDVFVFLYEDDGKGFDMEKTKRGYGWNNIETHVQSLRGNLLTDTAPGKGLAVTIEIPKT